MPLGRGLLGAVAATGEPRRGRLRTGAVRRSDEPRLPHVRRRAVLRARPSADDGPTPAGAHGTLGVLALYDRLGADEFDDADLLTLRTFAGQAGGGGATTSGCTRRRSGCR